MGKTKLKQSLSRCIKNAAQDKYIKLSPQVKLLIKVIGDTVEFDLYETNDDEARVLHLTDLESTSNKNENFHDTKDRSPYSSADE